MNVKFNAVFDVDIPIFAPDVINSDTIGDYKAELDCAIGDAVMMYILEHFPKGDVRLEYAIPADDSSEAIEEYGKLLENWITEYPKRIKKYEDS